MDTQNTINWQEPIEAVHEDGRVEPVFLSNRHEQPDRDGDYTLRVGSLGGMDVFKADGRFWDDRNIGWTIRNVTPATPTRTALEQRMEDLVRRMAEGNALTNVSQFYIEARAILAELEPVDGDEEFAKRVLGYAENGLMSRQQRIAMIKSDIRGRALERGESPVTNEGAGR